MRSLRGDSLAFVHDALAEAVQSSPCGHCCGSAAPGTLSIMSSRAANDGTVREFSIQVDDAVLEDLQRRLTQARWPQPETVDDWSQGIPLATTRALCDYWATGYRWRDRERLLNAHPQHLVRVDDLDIHCVHARSPHPDATPLILTHGWPGSFVEYLGLVDGLTMPASGRAEDAFHVVIPSCRATGSAASPRPPASASPTSHDCGPS